MPQSVATVVYGLVILGLFLLDRGLKSRVSPALWIPVAWVLLAGSRMFSDWLEPARAMQSPDQYLEGSPLDRLILTGLLAAGLMVLLTRGRRAGMFLRANGPILLFFLYGAVSVLWSDYPDVAFKRWTKALGDVVMVLVVLTDPDPSAAVKLFLGRSGFLLIPLSVLLVKYYPELGRGYSPWTWTPYYTGVATGKNGLGLVCLVFGLSSLWRFLEEFYSGERPRMAGPLIAHGAILAMTLWLFWMADSATSLTCFLLGGGLIAVKSLPGLTRTPTAVQLFVAGVLFLSLVGLFLDVGTDLVEAMGRDATLTGRTALWDELLRMTVDPWCGAGFESFWLGERAKSLWTHHWWHPNQAHNGYLEVFLNLGWIGVALLGLVMVGGFRNIIGAFRQDQETGRLRLAYFVVAVIYNLTEAAFKMMNPMWIAFLLAVTVIPEPSRREDG
jgi:exopolysaccharide production protein ExoQ